MSTQRADHRVANGLPSAGQFHRRWIVACTAGEMVGIGTAAGAAVMVSSVFGTAPSPGLRILTLALFALVGAVEGGVLAALQWRVLRTRLPQLRAGEWIAVTVAVAVLGWLVGMVPSTLAEEGAAPAPEPTGGTLLLLAMAAGAGAGFLFGAAQWFVLRRHAPGAGRWIWVHVPAWALALAAIFLAASWPTSMSPTWVILGAGVAGGLSGGVLLGGITGFVARDLTPWVNERDWSLEGRVCVVTGANSGIGYETALGLARLGGTVILLCRRPTEAARARQAILEQHPAAHVVAVTCDLADFASVRAAAEELLRNCGRLDVLVHNAGAAFPRRMVTADGVEATLAVDVVGPFLLTALLRDRLERSAARVVTLTGIYHRRGRVDLADLHFSRKTYDWLAANNQAQRGRLLFVAELARRAPHLTTAAVHPGGVLTGAQDQLPWIARMLIRTLLRPGFVRAEVGAMPVVRLAADPTLRGVTGRFFDRYALTPDQPDAADAEAFWNACESMTGTRWPTAPTNAAGVDVTRLDAADP